MQGRRVAAGVGSTVYLFFFGGEGGDTFTQRKKRRLSIAICVAWTQGEERGVLCCSSYGTILGVGKMFYLAHRDLRSRLVTARARAHAVARHLSTLRTHWSNSRSCALRGAAIDCRAVWESHQSFCFHGSQLPTPKYAHTCLPFAIATRLSRIQSLSLNLTLSYSWQDATWTQIICFAAHWENRK
jgi:hypothetical protein